jgi:hypothetical protein
LAELVSEAQGMRQVEPGHGDPIGPLDWRKIIPVEPAASSDRLVWVNLEAARFRDSAATEFNQPSNTHHMFVLFALVTLVGSCQSCTPVVQSDPARRSRCDLGNHFNGTIGVKLQPCQAQAVVARPRVHYLG